MYTQQSKSQNKDNLTKIVRTNSLGKVKLPDFATITLTLMSRDNLGNKHTIALHNCLIQNERYDLVITPHRRKIGFFRSKKNKKEGKNKKKLLNKIFPKHETQFRNLIQLQSKNFKILEI